VYRYVLLFLVILLMMDVEAQFVNFRYKSDSFSVCRMLLLKILDANKEKNHLPTKGKEIIISGSLPAEIFVPNQKYFISGNWTQTKWGYQLKVSDLRPLQAETKEEIVEFLGSGLIKGVRERTAKKIVDAFGKNAIRIIETNPEKLCSIKGISKRVANNIAESYKEQKKELEKINSLLSLGLSIIYAKKVLKVWGDKAYKMIKENPYVLTEIQGIGFLRADKVAEKMKIKPDDHFRIKAGLEYALRETCYSMGHTFLKYNELLEGSQKLLQIEEKKIRTFMEDTLPEDILFSKGYFYPAELYYAEKYTGSTINKLALMNTKFIKPYSDGFYSMLTDEQKKAVENALIKRISVITGLPGTGKTFSIRAIIETLERAGISYALAAPTGKAAKRIEELTGRSAKTIHRLLEVKWDKESNRVIFTRNESNPLDEKYVIVDESSMIDILLAKRLMEAISDETNVVLVGDYNQLPSVAPGNFLRDIVDNDLCSVARLKKIHRQAETSTIVRAAHTIHNGGNLWFFNDRDFIFIEEEGPEGIAGVIKKVVEDGTYSEPMNTQILSPMKKGECGTERLNEILRDRLRRYNIDYLRQISDGIYCLQDVETSFKDFFIGDKVIQLQNNYRKEVFNGEIGYVIEIDKEEQKIRVVFDDRVIEYEDYELDELALAYALTVHKYQGSEADCIVMPVTTSHYIMLYRNLLYTAVTRAKKVFVMVGTKKALAIAIKNNKPIQRNSRLHDWL